MAGPEIPGIESKTTKVSGKNVRICELQDTMATVCLRRRTRDISSLCLPLSVGGILNRNFHSLLATEPINIHDSESSYGHTQVTAQTLTSKAGCHPQSAADRERVGGAQRRKVVSSAFRGKRWGDQRLQIILIKVNIPGRGWIRGVE